MTPWLVTFALLVVTLGGYTIAVSPRQLWAVLFLGAMYAVILVGVGNTLGLAKPSWLGLPSTVDVEVVAATWDEGNAIWVWVREPGSPGPRAYVLPWSEKQAGKLHEDLEQSQKDGVQVRMKLPVGWSPPVPFMSYPEPQMPPPPKDGAQ